MQNVGSSTYVDGFTVNTTVKFIWNFQYINETNINIFTIKQILIATSYMMLLNLLVNTKCIEF